LKRAPAVTSSSPAVLESARDVKWTNGGGRPLSVETLQFGVVAFTVKPHAV
jgi:hypothetical protein